MKRFRILFRHLQIRRLQRRFEPNAVLGVYAFINGSLSIGLLAAVAHLTHSPFVFPSLGPTAFLLYYQPTAAAASPRHTVLGHLIGAVCGWGSLAIFGLLDAPPAVPDGVTGLHVAAAALSLGATSALMILFRAAHPPAGATTLIISLGLMPHLWQVGVLMIAVILLVMQAHAVNRLAGIHYPWWQTRR